MQFLFTISIEDITKWNKSGAQGLYIFSYVVGHVYNPAISIHDSPMDYIPKPSVKLSFRIDKFILYYCLALQYSLKKFFQFYRKTSTFFSSIHDHFFFLSTEPVVRLSHRTDFVVAGMDKSTRAICFVSGQEFIGWFKSTGEQIIGTSPNHRMYVEDEDDSYSLVIRRLMQSDGGEYVCRGTKTSATYSLYVECKCCMV